MQLRKVMFLSIATIAALSGLMLILSGVLRERVYAGFLTKAESIHVGDSAETVKAKMAPHQATTNNSDLTLPESRVVVFPTLRRDPDRSLG
jgi:hypothetical protein